MPCASVSAKRTVTSCENLKSSTARTLAGAIGVAPASHLCYIASMRYDDDERVAALERQVPELTGRLEQLERRLPPELDRSSVYSRPPRAAKPGTEDQGVARPPRPSAPKMDFEDLLGG